ncbi:sulfurtransferase-like selenium metabolism protein YedF [Spongorhabdus nitratireducens]
MNDKHQASHMLDVRNCPCPRPLIKTRKLWETLEPGEQIRILLNNETALTYVIAFLNSENAEPVTLQDNDDWIVTAVREKPAVQKASKCATCAENDNYVVVLKSNVMGQGDNELGQMLVNAYINALRDLDKKPAAVVLYNTAVLLATKGSGADKVLSQLADQGVDIILSGTCVEHLQIRDLLHTGRLSNMYEIAGRMAAAGRLIYP